MVFKFFNLLTFCLLRLEAATSRLEDLTEFQTEALKGIAKTGESTGETTSKDTSSSAPAASTQAVPVPAAPSAPAPPKAPEPAAEQLPVSVAEFDAYHSEFVVPYLEASKKIGGLVEEQSKALDAAFKAEREYLQIVAKAKKPATDAAHLELLSKITNPLQDVVSIRESNRTSPQTNHLAAVAEGAPALTWPCVTLPVGYVRDYKDSAQFYSNRVLKEFKEVDKSHVEWVQSFTKALTGLEAYVKKHHTTGPAWNAQGVPVEEAVASVAKSAPAPAPAAAPAAAAPPPPPAPPGGAGAPPPPPPPPPPADLFADINTSAPADNSGGMSAVFEQLNQGSSVTSGLKKVDKSQMTHKNPELRNQPPATSGQKKSPAPPKKPASLAAKKRPAKKELQDSKWIIENFENDHEIIVDVELQQSVFIDKCVNSTIQVRGKANAITINSSTGVGLVVDSLVSGVDVIKCKKLGLQVTGVIPTISIDQSDGVQFYLSKDSLATEIYTSQTTAMNILVPNADEDFDENPVPEQFVHKIGPNGKLVSSIVEHAG